MHTHTIRAFILSTFAALAGCFTEDFDPFLPYGSSSTTEATGSSTAADTTTGAAVEPEAEPARACVAPEDVPPSLPGIDLAVELEPQASGTCPTSWCVENVSCVQCCNGEYPTFGTTECCVSFGNQSPPSSAGTCGGSQKLMQCILDAPPADPTKPRRTPVPTECNFPSDVVCPEGSHPGVPAGFPCPACATGLGQPCGFNNTCQFCEG